MEIAIAHGMYNMDGTRPLSSRCVLTSSTVRNAPVYSSPVRPRDLRRASYSTACDLRVHVPHRVSRPLRPGQRKARRLYLLPREDTSYGSVCLQPVLQKRLRLAR